MGKLHMIKGKELEAFEAYLRGEEKSELTIEKYRRDVRMFLSWLGDQELVNKAAVLEYKAYLVERYSTSSVNSMLSSLNSFFTFLRWEDCRVKALKWQRQLFRPAEKELTQAEYHRLLKAARHNQRLFLLMQTICSTGIRVSEHRHVTVEAARAGQAQVRCKGKCRTILLPKALCGLLLDYAREKGIQSGSVFVTRGGRPLDRSNIWSDMKKLCQTAGVPGEKVFPHNLRHLFARTYYSIQKDIVRLADILGHASIDTTRVYTVESGTTHRRQIEKMGLLSA